MTNASEGALEVKARVAVVAGGAGGIGAAVCKKMADLGCSVAVGFWQEDHSGNARSLAASLNTSAGQEHIAVPLEIRDPGSCGEFIDAVGSSLGRVDVVVNSAGVNRPFASLDVSEDLWDEIVDTDLKGAFFLSQAAARAMVAQGGSSPRAAHYSIIHISSQLGLVGLDRRAPYCASKAGLVNLARVLAIEWAPYGIRVNTVAPTVIRTPLTETLLDKPDYLAEIEQGSPLAQVGDPEDVAHGVAYLAGAGARLVTGHTLVIDGGWTAW